MFSPSTMGYDRAITVFSPDGRLFQVEYALEAVRKGWTTIGILCPDGVILAVEKRRPSQLITPTSMEKIHKIDEHIGVAFAGLAFDARVLIDQARIYAQSYRLTYGESIDVELLTKWVCDIKQAYTQHAGVRPFGVSFIIGGVDSTGPRLFGTEPGGAYVDSYAYAIGIGGQVATDYLDKHYRHDLSLDDALILAVQTLNKAIEGGVESERIEMAVIKTSTKKFEKLSHDVVKKYIEEVKKEK
ncbi:MAG: archaeal proteasome endopeptidase complex subunit alpha [Candidatus Methanomethylicia archaeon]